MRSFSELSKSLGRSSSSTQSKRPSILPEKAQEKESNMKETNGDTLTVPTGEENKPTKSLSADDLFATFDALTSSPSQDISRPFDPLPPSRPSDAKSISKRKNRQSVVPAIPPTVDTLQVSLTPFGEAFKSFVQDPQPPTIATTKPPSPSISAIPSLTSNTTLDDVSVNTLLSPPNSQVVPTAQTAGESDTARQSQASPTPRTRRTSVFKGILGVMYLKEKVSTYWQPSSSSDSGTRERRSSKPTPPTSPSPFITVTPGVDDKDASSSITKGLGSFRRLGRRSKEIPTSPTAPTAPTSLEQNLDGTASAVKPDENASALVPPVPVGSTIESGRASPVSMKYSHAVHLHPVPEEDIDTAVQQ